MIGLIPLDRIPALLGAPSMSVGRVLRLLALVSRPPGRKAWSRRTVSEVTIEQLVGLRAAFALAGGADALTGKRRLKVAKLRRVAHRFEELYDVTSPLSRVRFERVDNVIVAYLDGVLLDPETGQALLAFVGQPGGSGEAAELAPMLATVPKAPVAPTSQYAALPILVPRAWRRGAK